ncbi:glycosyl hydrolases family 31-domain-containing protein [Phaeosphaeria sp. MPI-PUGE-AT-0046c]|nr:glycosyl hydrolases family 31-domain-containing protein [Phaeosphaeria sp. MPI-PUGE-AT-0046c]
MPARYDFKTRHVAHPDAVVAGDKYRFTILTDGLMRFEWAEDGKFEDRASTFAINRRLAVPDYFIWDRGHGIEIVTKRLHVVYNKKKFSADGLKVILKGAVTGTWNFGDNDGVLSRDGISVIDDSESMMFEDNGWIAGRRGGREERPLHLHPLLPRYAMGNWWSRFHAYDEKEYYELHDHFDKDDDLFPDPDKFMKNLHDRGMKLTLNLHPALGIRPYEDQYKDVAKYMGVDPATEKTIEFDCTDKKFMDAYFDIVHHQHEKRGVDFWWIDWQQGNTSKIPGVDPLWVLNHFHFLDSGRGSQRPLVFSRFGGPGAQRYQIGFSGDAVITWETLHFQPEFTATASNIGYGWWSNDIGGHTHGYKDDELYTRWVQLGCWSPILRLHSDNNPFNTREPWRYGVEACGVVEETLRLRHRLIPYLYTMNARCASQDEPLIQPMYWDHPEDDEAYNVPNQFYFGSELIAAPITQARSSTTKLGAAKVWLPAGKYVDIFTGLVYNRKGELTVHRPTSQTPVFASEGAIIPLDGAWRPKSGSPNPTCLEVLLVVGADGSFNLLEDDGSGTHESSDENNVSFVSTPIVYKQSTGVLKIGPAGPHNDHDVVPKKRDWKIRLLAHTPAHADHVTCLSTTAAKKHHAKPLKHEMKTEANGTVIMLSDVPTEHTIIINLLPSSSSTSLSSKGPQLDIIDPLPRLYKIIDGAQSDLEQQRDLWNTVNNGNSVLNKVRDLQGKGLEGEFLDALLEVLLADERVEKEGTAMDWM